MPPRHAPQIALANMQPVPRIEVPTLMQRTALAAFGETQKASQKCQKGHNSISRRNVAW